MSARFGKVAVLFGGSSAEREVSLMSGKAVLAAPPSNPFQDVAPERVAQTFATKQMLLDLAYAIAFGATHVRVGSAIFGGRPPLIPPPAPAA